MHPIAALTAAATTADAKTGLPQPGLVRAAHEFEAQMLKELLKPMTGSTALTAEDRDAEEDWGANGALGEFASEALGQAISRGGGFGIADRIIHDLSQSETGRESGKVTRNLHGNTVLRVPQSLK